MDHGWRFVTSLVIMAFLATVLAVPGVQAGAAGPASVGFDAAAATNAYLAKQTAEQKGRSDAYFEGGYWLQLWGFLYGAGIALLLLFGRVSTRLRDLAVRITPRPTLQSALYWVGYLVVTTVLSFPLTVYSGFVREKAYGLATQSFGGWMGDQAKGLLVGAILGGLALMALYAVFRHAPRTWWVWGSGLAMVFLVIAIAIGPVFIDPLFNKYTRLEDPVVREPILRLARANMIPATDVLVVDASKQTTRISANVAGMLGTERIALNDNLLKRCSLPEIEAVMAHEMGHYVLNHVWKGILQLGLVMVAGFAFVRWSFGRTLARWGGRWGVSGIADPAGLPLLVLLFSVFFLVATPVTNTIIRVQEAEADIYGLNAARQPDGFAETALKLGEYRKLSPGPIEEAVFFDHPSGRTRISMAMRWKAENLPAGPASAMPTASGGGF
ncbi:MAG TPA: M48 family metallopeptidase [Thermoanaerobaculaceae bacterium]|nr:M48 family metallopeptidase [Thermoanaerobaculaceae bacterium]HPS77224.1 M48 family metallopeptidase [Thermoanaerobaculaceae bacterium]